MHLLDNKKDRLRSATIFDDSAPKFPPSDGGLLPVAGPINDHLDELEAQSIYIFREAYASFKNICMPWSMGKDSNTLIWLAKKAFCGKIPFPLLHIDTTYEFPEMIEFRRRSATTLNFFWLLDDGLPPPKK